MRIIVNAELIQSKMMSIRNRFDVEIDYRFEEILKEKQSFANKDSNWKMLVFFFLIQFVLV